ncbi:MAG: acyl-CoA dehydrogenase family protein [Dehalococcoidales bacterium]|nr:acyl-CoA dehydrogenase family protein [Dehalococcoidales bacterium]
MNFELSEEQIMFRDMARRFAKQEMLPTLKDYERQRKVNYDVIKKMASLGLIGAHIPQEYGGLGLDYTTSTIIWEQLSQVSWTQTLTSVGQCVLAGTILTYAASEEQKKRYLPPLCRGEMIIAMAAVEPNAGSDATAIEASAVLDGDEWVINGNKNFISHGSIADVVLVLVQTDKAKGAKGMAVIAVDKGTPGFSSREVEMLGGRAGDIASLGFSDCRAPKENLVGEVGRGLQNSLVGIDTARLFIAAGGVGMAQGCLDASIKYAKERRQFGKPIASFQLVQETIARMQAEISAIRWQVYYAAELKSQGKPHAKELSAAKWLATELAVRVSNEAVRLHGAYGCTDDFPVEQHYRDSVLSTILGGTTEMHKLLIGRELLDINAMV